MSSRASMSSWTSAAAVMKPTERPFWQPPGRDRGRCGSCRSHCCRARFLAALDVLAAGQLQDQRLVERGDDLEVEAVEALDHGEARRLDAPLDHAALAVDQLELGESQQVADVIDPSEAHCRAILSYSRRKVGSFSVLRWWASSLAVCRSCAEPRQQAHVRLGGRHRDSRLRRPSWQRYETKLVQATKERNPGLRRWTARSARITVGSRTMENE